MVNKKIVKIIKDLNKRIAEKYSDFKGSYLYGSRIRKTYHKDSDIDVVALFEELNWDKTFEISGIICDLMYKYDVYIDLHPYTPEELEQNSIYYNEVVNKGLYYGV